jgi:hypothetical protein
MQPYVQTHTEHRLCAELQLRRGTQLSCNFKFITQVTVLYTAKKTSVWYITGNQFSTLHIMVA